MVKLIKITKIILVAFISNFILFGINTNINAYEYINNYEYKINDYIFFPSHGMHSSVNLGFINSGISPLSNDNSIFNTGLYDIFYKKDMFYVYSIGEYKILEYKQKLFKEIFNYEYNNQKNIKAIKDGYNNSEYKNREKELKKEIKLAKLRYDDTKQAELDYNKFSKDIKDVLELYFNNLDIKLASLIKKDNYEDNICGYNLEGGLKFETNSLDKNLNSKNIKEYYIFGLDNSWSNGSPIWKDYAPAIIIKNKTDLEKIDKTKYFVKKVNPEFFIKEIKDKFYESEISKTKEKNSLEEIKEYYKIISKNKELKINISQEEIIKYLDNNKYLYKSKDGDYAFGKGHNTTKLFTFILLGVDKNSNIIVLSDGKDGKIDVGNYNYGLEQNCTRYYSDIYNNRDNKEYIYLVSKIENIFKKLDNKFNLDKYYNFIEKSRFIDNNSVFTITLEERKEYNAYLDILNKLNNKLNNISLQNNNKINLFLNKDLKYITNNKNKLNKLFLRKELLTYLDFIIYFRKNNLENALGIKHDMGILLTK